MLINNLGTSTQSLELLSGIYYFNLFNLETSDPLDLIRISGDNFQWKYSGELDWREPYNGNEYTEYADTINQGLTIVFNVIESATFNLRTDDTFEYPNDDTPTNPIIDIEILQAGDYSAIAEDWLGAVDNNILSTGDGAIASEEIQDSFFHNNVDLTQYGVEGTAALWVTEPGINKVDVTINGTAKLLLWDGSNIVPFTVNGAETLYFETVSDEWGFVVLDESDSSNIASVEFDNFIWYDSAPEGVDIIKYEEPSVSIPISLIPDRYLGDVDLYQKQTRINSGRGDKAINALSSELGIDLTDYGTEGSYATWNVEDGIYEITYFIHTRENDFNHDAVYFSDGTDLSLFALRSSATNQIRQRKWISESTTQQVEVVKGELTFITLDTGDKKGTTQLRINKIEKVGDLSDNDTDNNTDNPYSYIYEEPPYPIPANNKDLGNDSITGLNLGVLKPWESDTDTGTEYNQGYIYGSYHLGASYITEFIGGDDISDYINFSLDESSYINFYHSNAIAEILDSNNQVVVGSNDSYSGNLQAYLSPGNYSIGFSSESSTPELFNASIYLSNSDPNYAD